MFVGISATPRPAGAAGAAAVARADAGGAHRVERRDLDGREPRNPRRPVARRRARLCRKRRRRLRRRCGDASGRRRRCSGGSRSRVAISLAPVAEIETVRRMIAAGFQTIARAPRPRLLVGLIVAQAFVRGCLNVLIVVAVFQVFGRGAAEVGYLTAAMGVGGLVGAAGATTLGATTTGRGLRHCPGVLGASDHAHGPRELLRGGDRPVGDRRRCQQRRRRRAVHAAPADHPRRRAHPGPRPRLGPRHGRRRDRVDCSAGGCRTRSGRGRHSWPSG